MMFYEDALYFYGGKFEDHKSMNDLYKLNIDTYTWSKIDVGTSKPPGLFSFGCVVYEDYMYLIHGFIYEDHEHETGLWRVNLKNNEKVWEHYYFAPQDEVVQLDRDSFGLVRNLDKVYLFGGRTMKGLQNDLLELDLQSSIYSWDILSKSTVKHYHSRVTSEILSNYTHFEEIAKVKSNSKESNHRNNEETLHSDKYNHPKLDEISSYSHTRLPKSSFLQEFLYSLMYGVGVGSVIGMIMLCYSMLKLKYLYSSTKTTHKKIYSLDDVDMYLFLKAFHKRKALTNRRHSIG
jgi:hypothetical protein